MRVVEAVESLAKSWDPLLPNHATRITRKISKRRAAGCVSLGSIHTSSLSQAGPGLPSHLSQWVSYGQNIGAPALRDGQKQSNLRRDFPLLLPSGKAPLPAAGVGVNYRLLAPHMFRHQFKEKEPEARWRSNFLKPTLPFIICRLNFSACPGFLRLGTLDVSSSRDSHKRLRWAERRKVTQQ